MKKTAVAVLAAVAAATMVLSGCASGGNGNTSGKSGSSATDTSSSTEVNILQPAPSTPITDLKIGNFLDVTNWDPAGADIGFDGPYLSAVYDPLVRIDAKGQPTPALATKWSYNADRTQLTMHLRTGVKFSDGEPFNAKAAVAGIEHLKNGTTAREAYTKVTSVTAIDDDTIRIDLSARDDTMLYLMGTGRSWMAAPNAIKAGTLSKTPVGSGPYTLDASKSTPGSLYTFVKNPDYWDPSLFPFKTVTIKPFLDAKARQNAFDGGQTNLTYGQTTDFPKMKQQGKNITEKVGSWVGILFTDHAGKNFPQLGKTKVRQAINLAFDGSAILKAIADGIGVPSDQVFSADGPIFDTSLNSEYQKNITKAKKLMKEAGYPDGFSVTMPMSPVFQTWQAVAQQGLNAIGIKVKWDNMQQPDYQSKAAQYPMFVAVVAMDSDSASTVERQVAQPQWYNPNAVADVAAYPAVQSLVQKVQTATGQDQLDAIKQLNKKLTSLAWFDVWYQGMNIYYSQPGIVVKPVTGQMFPTLDLIKQQK